jgi:putative ABC transport system permease protein
MFTASLSVAASLAFGLAPAFRFSKPDLMLPLKETSTLLTRRLGSLPGSLILVEAAAGLVLLIGAGLLLQTVARLWSVPLGFDPRNILVFMVDLPRSRYPAAEQMNAYLKLALERIQRVQGVEGAALAAGAPFTGYITMDFEVEGHRVPAGSGVQAMPVSPGYFATLGTHLIRGRDFADSDGVRAPPVAIINRSMAQHFWPNENPIGKQILVPADPDARTNEQLRIVGVVQDLHQLGFEQAPAPTVYLSYYQLPSPGGVFLVRTAVNPYSLRSLLLAQIREIDPDVSVSDVTTMTEVLEASVAPRRLAMLLLTAFAALALLLDGIGIYGVVAFVVAQRTHEIAVRMALGARRRDVVRLVVGQSMRSTLLGVALGLVCALAVTRGLSGLLFGVEPNDPATFAGSSCFVAAVGLLACYFPALRATRLDPMETLRHQ